MAAESLAAPVHPLAVRSGAELVELSERYHRGVFLGALVFVGLAAIAALALLPLRASVPSDRVPPTAYLAGLLALATPLAVRYSGEIDRLLRRDLRAQVLLVVIATALIVYPLRSELWWPSCALLMLIATVAPLARTFVYCLVALLANLAAHVVAGDLGETPAVTIIGLWIGYFFWTATFGVIGDRLSAHVLRLSLPVQPRRDPPLRVPVWGDRAATQEAAGGSGAPPRSPPVPRGDEATLAALGQLTARQLQVVALLADGLRYRDIATCLSISERQVQRHVTNAIERVAVRSAVELVARVVDAGMVPGASGAATDG